MSAERPGIAPIRRETSVGVAPGDAFAAFTDGMNHWWPRDLTWSGELLERIGIDARVGGFCTEIAAGGMRLDWGRVTAWEPPHRLAFSWQIGPDRAPEVSPARASQVEVRFEPIQGGTRLTLLHDGWERHGDQGAAYRERLEGDGIWTRLLDAYARVAAARDEAPWSGVST